MQGEDFSQTLRCAAAAVHAMERLDIVPHPRNFTLWYAYHSGIHPDLTETIDQLIEAGGSITEQRNEVLYERFFGSVQFVESIEHTDREMGDLLERTRADLESAGSDAQAFGNTISALTGTVETAEDADELQGLIDGIIAECRLMDERNQTIEQKLEQSSKRIGSLHERLDAVKKETMTDSMTKLANRRAFDSQLGEETVQAAELGESVSLLMLDIDHFKRFNDSYGHQVGDQVIKLVARTLVQTLKGRDIPARYGGEEFAVILPSTELEKAAQVAEKIRQKLASCNMTRRGGGEDYGQVTLSIGAALYRPGEALGDFVARADKALYAAKEGGRNRVVTEIAIQ